MPVDKFNKRGRNHIYRKKPFGKKSKKRILYGGALLVVIVFLFFSAIFFTRATPVQNNPLTPSQVISRIENFQRNLISESKPQLIKVENRVRRGDTIINALRREGLDYQAAHKFFTEVKPIYNLRKINAGKKYTLFLSQTEKTIEKFQYEIDINQYLEVCRDTGSNSFKGKIITVPFEKRKELVRGTINYSLFDTIKTSGEKAELADILASLFEYDIDFNRDIQPGDYFAVVVEKKYLKGEFVTYGQVMAAEFVNRGKAIRLVRFTDPEGNTAYYHPDGRSVRKMFLRCPLPFMRVTSRYGFRKRHPVMKFSARHNGVDFGAPRGTKVRASASGVIKRMGYGKAMGRYIMIRHPNHYVSHYYHLNGFRKGIRRGVKVEQGQIIGYVGSTGWSTGPHLHYGLQKSGRYLNPLRLKSPTKQPVKKKYMQDFRRYTSRLFLYITGSRLMKLPEPLKNTLLGPDQSKQIQTTPSISL